MSPRRSAATFRRPAGVVHDAVGAEVAKLVEERDAAATFQTQAGVVSDPVCLEVLQDGLNGCLRRWPAWPLRPPPRRLHGCDRAVDIPSVLHGSGPTPKQGAMTLRGRALETHLAVWDVSICSSLCDLVPTAGS